MAEKLYPDLGDDSEDMETDPLGALPAVSKPLRPPPPHSSSAQCLQSGVGAKGSHSPGPPPRAMSLQTVPVTQVLQVNAGCAGVLEDIPNDYTHMRPLPSPPGPL